MSENGFITREQLTARAKRRYLEFDVPHLGKVRIRNLTERERSRFESVLLSNSGGLVKSKLENAKRRLIVETVVDAQGELILKPADVAALEEQDGAVTSLIYEEAKKHCGFDRDDIEELVGNSGTTTACDSPTA